MNSAEVTNILTEEGVGGGATKFKGAGTPKKRRL